MRKVVAFARSRSKAIAAAVGAGVAAAVVHFTGHALSPVLKGAIVVLVAGLLTERAPRNRG